MDMAAAKTSPATTCRGRAESNSVSASHAVAGHSGTTY
jgi:hypothetical protein